MFKENPLFVLYLGICPALGVTNSIENAVGMGVGVLFVLLVSNIIISLIRNIIVDQVRIPLFIMIFATLGTVLQMAMQAYTLDLYESMKVFIPLIVVNCVVMGRAEAFAKKNTVDKSIVDALGMGLGYLLAMALIAVFRQLLGTGELLGIQIFPEYLIIPAFTSAVGAFLTFGFLTGLIMIYINKKTDIRESLEKIRIEELKKAAAEKTALKLDTTKEVVANQ